jgi:hypothetical protein
MIRWLTDRPQETPKNHLLLINEAIQQLPMLFKIDLVDFYNVEETFKRIALSNVEVL